MSKSPDAFRTIREVADWLGVAAHVLRFWESKFTQIRPVKRAGGRRYYRPADMELVGGIKVLLHDRGMTVRGVQRMLREEGVAAVAGCRRRSTRSRCRPELVEGIAEEAAWHDDARAEAVETDAKTPELTEETSGVPVADARSDPEPEPEPDRSPKPQSRRNRSRRPPPRPRRSRPSPSRTGRNPAPPGPNRCRNLKPSPKARWPRSRHRTPNPTRPPQNRARARDGGPGSRPARRLRRQGQGHPRGQPPPPAPGHHVAPASEGPDGEPARRHDG
jgi:DNA-binding transcriptional MerR regulator